MADLSFSSLSSDPNSDSRAETALYRLSQSHSFQKTELNSAQTAVDQGVTHFLDGVFDTKTGLALLGGGVANRLGKLGFAAAFGSPRSSLVSTLVRGGSTLAGFTVESATFAGLSQGFLSPSFGKNWAHAAATLGPLKIFPSLFPNQNLISQHLLTDLGMVAGDHLAYRMGVGEKPEGDLSTQLARAEALNWQMKGTLSLAHGLLPQVGALEKTMDLAQILKSRGPKVFDLSSFEPLAVAEGDPRHLGFPPELPSKKGPTQENILAMTGLRAPASSGEAVFRKATDAEIKQVKQEFGEALLTQLFGKYHGKGVEILAAFFVNRAEMREKYGAKAFAEAGLAKRRSLLSSLIKDSESIRVSFEQAPGPAQAQEGLFAQAMNLFCYFQDHNKAKLTELKWSGFKGGTNPLPSEFMQPNINIGGEKLHILTNFRGLYELGRAQFFGDTTVSPKHLFLSFHQGYWYLVDGKSLYGTYYYDAAKKSWEAYSNEQWTLLQSKDILNIGNAYYRMFILGGTVHFDPVSLPPEIEPNTIRRFISVTFNGRPYPMEVKPTPQGEVGLLQVGTILFLYRRGQYSILHLGQEGILRLRGFWVPTAFNQQLQQIDYTKAVPLNNGDKFDYFGQKNEVWIDENGSVNVSKLSAWATFVPPPAFNPQAPIVSHEWYASGAPKVEESKIKMNGAQTLLIGRMGQKDVTEPLVQEAGIHQYSIENKPWYRLWFSGPVWIQIKKHAASQRFEVTNVGIKEGITLRDNQEKDTKVEKGNLGIIKAGDEVLFQGRRVKIQP